MSSPPAITPPIRAVVFDLGDVFFPWPQAAFFARWEARLGITPHGLHRMLSHGPDIEAANVGAVTAEEYARRCARRLRADQTLVRELIEAAFAGEPINAALVTYARSLRSRVRLAALTNTWSFGRTLIQRRGITALFDLIVTSAEEGVTKPDARNYQTMLDRLCIRPAEAVFIDDNNENVEAPRATGIRSILFVTNEQTIADLEALLVRCGSARD